MKNDIETRLDRIEGRLDAIEGADCGGLVDPSGAGDAELFGDSVNVLSEPGYGVVDVHRFSDADNHAATGALNER